MLLNDNTAVLNVPGITAMQMDAMLEFFKGAINSHCHKNPDEWFSARDFLGWENKNWSGHSLQGLYDKWKIARRKSASEARKLAGIDAGKLLKIVIVKDRRNFEVRNTKKVREYKLVR